MRLARLAVILVTVVAYSAALSGVAALANVSPWLGALALPLAMVSVIGAAELVLVRLSR